MVSSVASRQRVPPRQIMYLFHDGDFHGDDLPAHAVAKNEFEVK
jgi:hypothetical protein